MLSYDIVIIDSGIKNQDELKCPGICIQKTGAGFSYCNYLEDDIGHGTVIFSLIHKQVVSASIYVIKISNVNGEYDDSCLVSALKYVKQNIECKFINMSLGVQCGDNIQELYDICKELSNAGTTIISAFDTDGCYSYPAAFDCVIGVDSSQDLKNSTQFDYVDGGPINVFGKGGIQRLKINNSDTLLVGGSSIACAHITSVLVNAMATILDFPSALMYLKTKARYVFSKQNNNNKIKWTYADYKIINASVFPFSKEAQAFLRFSHMLPFKINGYYDISQSGKVGRKLSSYYPELNTDDHILNVDKIDFSNIDTLILGHLDQLNGMINRDYRAILIAKAIKEHVNIYSFDPLDAYIDLLETSNIKYYYPSIKSLDVPQHSFGKLYKIDKPVVGIFGTSSRQGKFSLQLTLKNKLEFLGYEVGTVGTEPHSLLFDFDVVFPMGYNSTVHLKNSEIVLFLNNAINSLCRKQKEIILVASQAQTIPYCYNNLLEIPTLQYHFAIGTKPDVIVMCINYFDDISYIRRSVYTLIGLTKATVVAFAMYPITYSESWNGVYGEEKRNITDFEFVQRANELAEEFKIPVYMLGDIQHMNDLCDLIINCF